MKDVHLLCNRHLHFTVLSSVIFLCECQLAGFCDSWLSNMKVSYSILIYHCNKYRTMELANCGMQEGSILRGTPISKVEWCPIITFYAQKRLDLNTIWPLNLWLDIAVKCTDCYSVNKPNLDFCIHGFLLTRQLLFGPRLNFLDKLPKTRLKVS